MLRIDAQSVGRQVAAYRRNMGLTAEELARELGPEMTGNAITKLERGHRAQISPDLLLALARVLGVSPLALLFPLDDPHASVVVNGASARVREIGGWLLGDEDIVTRTFRQLVAADSAVARAETEMRAAEGEAAIDARLRLVDEIARRDVLETHLRRIHSDLFGERPTYEVTDGEHQAES